MIGGGLYRALKSAGGAVLGTTRRESAEHLHLDFGRPEDFRIPRGVDVTVICAGIGDIAACAQSPQETSRVNVSGAAEIAGRAAESGSRVVMLSSSLVFDGQGDAPQAGAALTPCCEYGRQKAALESRLAREKVCAIVRLTKVVETLRPRFSGWLGSMRSNRTIKASTALRFSPVSLEETVHALRGLALSFQPGIFHISGDETFTYHDAAVRLAKARGIDPDLVAPDAQSGVEFFEPLPVTASLAPAVLSGCSGWRFSPSSSILNAFIRSL